MRKVSFGVIGLIRGGTVKPSDLDTTIFDCS
jgi:hypothetical protein